MRVPEQAGQAPGPGPSLPGEAGSDLPFPSLGWAGGLWLRLQASGLSCSLCVVAVVTAATGQGLERPAEDDPHAGSTEEKVEEGDRAGCARPAAGVSGMEGITFFKGQDEKIPDPFPPT